MSTSSDRDLSHLPPLREVIRENGLAAKKSLGQNFLLDLNITEKIVRHAGLGEDVNAIEIGPGPGGLTRALVGSEAKTVTAIERDERCISALAPLVEASNDRLKLLYEDALTVDLTDLVSAPRAIVANLPYNIATPLLISWLKQSENFQSMTLMFQKEVAGRIVAKVGTKAYSRLSVISQWLCDVSIAFDLPPGAFTPPPKVTSSIVHLRPKAIADDAPSFETVERVTGAAFNQRRKMLRQSMKSLVPDIKAFLSDVGIDETLRADNVTVEQFIVMAKALESKGQAALKY